MSLRDVMEQTSIRQYIVWLKFIDLQWNQPSRTDYYIMGLRLDLRNMFRKVPHPLKQLLSICGIPFPLDTPTKSKPKPLTAAEITARDMAIFGPLVGYKETPK